jgi:DinB superfamily
LLQRDQPADGDRGAVDLEHGHLVVEKRSHAAVAGQEVGEESAVYDSPGCIADQVADRGGDVLDERACAHLVRVERGGAAVGGRAQSRCLGTVGGRVPVLIEEVAMNVPGRLAPLLAQFDAGRERLSRRLVGPTVDSGDGEPVAVPPLTDDEYLWEPVAGCWSVRRHGHGPGSGATVLVGAGEWGRDGGRPHPCPPPVTTIAWRLEHLAEMLEGRADHLIGSHTHTEEEYVVAGTAAEGVAAFERGASAWRGVLTSADDEALDAVGRSTYPYGSDPEDPLIETVWWVNQELLHHAAEIALLRDLYRSRPLAGGLEAAPQE